MTDLDPGPAHEPFAGLVRAAPGADVYPPVDLRVTIPRAERPWH